MHASRAIPVILIALASACTKKEEDAASSVSTTAPVVTDAGAGTRLELGKTVEGVFQCGRATSFLVDPPVDGKARVELRIPPGGEKHCRELNARDAKLNLLKKTLTLCSDDPAKFAAMEAPFGKDALYLTLDPADALAHCVAATFRVTIAK